MCVCVWNEHLLGHEGPEDGCDHCEAVLSAEDGSVGPSVCVDARGVDDECDGKRAESICEGRQAREHAAKSERSNLRERVSFWANLDGMRIPYLSDVSDSN